MSTTEQLAIDGPLGLPSVGSHRRLAELGSQQVGEAGDHLVIAGPRAAVEGLGSI